MEGFYMLWPTNRSHSLGHLRQSCHMLMKVTKYKHAMMQEGRAIP